MEGDAGGGEDGGEAGEEEYDGDDEPDVVGLRGVALVEFAEGRYRRCRISMGYSKMLEITEAMGISWAAH